MRYSTILFALLALLGWSGLTAAQESAEDGARISFRGVQRTRYEALDNQFRPGLSGSDQVLALQTSLYLEAKLKNLQFFGELMDSRGELNDSGSFVNNTVVNSVEPLQAYVSWGFRDFLQDGSESSIRAGRMTIDLGKRRVLARNRFRNTVNNFVGVDWQWRGAGGRSARAFYLVPMRGLPTAREALLDNRQRLDRAFRDTSLWGALYQLPAFSGGSRVELYWLSLDQGNRPNNAAPPRDLDTAGVRAYRPPMPGNWNYEIESIFQTGTSSANAAGVSRTGLDHRASLQHWEIGYAFEAPWSPNLMLQYDRASGDEDPFDDDNDAFDTLFGARRFDFGPTDIWGPFARSNLDSPAVRVTFNPAKRWQSMLSYRSFRLAEHRDAWVGTGVRDLTGQAGDSLGRQLEGSFTWTVIPERVTVETGFAHIWMGRYAEQVSGAAFRGDPSYVYAGITTNF